MSGLKKLLPLADRVLIRRVLPQTKTASGVFLPESSITKNNEGEVVAIGPGAKTKAGEVIPMTVSIGDKVLLPEYGGLAVKLDGDELHLFRNDEILGKFE
jgi:chaperonin GroES